MPDHIHFFCAPRDLSVSLKRSWMKYWKSLVSLRWPRPAEQPIWQLDFWDTQLRRGEKYDEKWDYVWRNPIRKGFVAKPEDWPYAGEINIFWHGMIGKSQMIDAAMSFKTNIGALTSSASILK